MSLTGDTVWRDHVVAGNSSSGKNKPNKAEIRAWARTIEGAANSSTVVKATLAALQAVTPDDETNGGVVLADSTASNNGFYYRSGGAWVKGRGFPDSFAKIALAGTANAQTGSVDSGVDPSSVEVYYAVVSTDNTGPMTLSISGETARDVVNAAGNALSAGEWTGVVLFFLNTDGDYQLLIDAGAAAAAAQSATEAAASLAEFLTHFLGNFADDATAATAAGTPVEGQFYWNTTSKVFRYYDGSAWNAFPYATVADGSLDEVKYATGSVSTRALAGEAVTNEKVADTFKAKIMGVAADRTALAAMSGSTYLAVDLMESGRKGLFMWNGSDLSALVTADPNQGVYVPPTTDATGASGAWERQFDGDLHAMWFGLTAAGTAAANTSAINAAINLADELGCGVALPGIEFNVDAGLGGGIVVKNNTHLYGQGRRKTILYLQGGGTLAQLRNYQAGAGIRRDFTIDGLTKPYVSNVLIEHLAVVLNHPLASITTTAIQIGIDFRNITRSEVRHCWVGNYHPITDTKGGTAPYLCQGWAYLTGNESGGADYAGGEVNTFRRNFVAGAWRAVAIDDNQLTPTSAAYSQRILENDIQIAQILIYQASSFGAGNVTRDNVLQSTVAKSGDASGNFGIYIAGYGNTIDEPYGEYGSTCTAILQLAGSANSNRARFSGTCSVTGGLTGDAFVDSGGGTSYNIVEYFANTGGAGVHDSLGSPQRMISGLSTTQS